MSPNLVVNHLAGVEDRQNEVSRRSPALSDQESSILGTLHWKTEKTQLDTRLFMGS